MRAIVPDLFISSEPMRQLIDSRRQFDEALLQFTAAAQQSICLFDADWQYPFYESQQWHAALECMLRSDRKRQLRVVLRDVDAASRRGERLKQLQRQYSSQVQIHLAIDDAARQQDTLFLADQLYCVRRAVSAQPRGVVVAQDLPAIRPWQDRFEEIWAQSVVAITAKVLGL